MGLISYTGAQGTGKTTAAFNQSVDLKLKYPGKTTTILAQIENMCPFLINKNTSYPAQMWIFTEQLNKEVTLNDRFDLVVTDRTVVDAAAYSMVAGMEGLAMAMLDLAAKHMHIYDKIFFRTIKNNNYCFDDGHRSIDQKFRADVESVLRKMYDHLRNDTSMCEVVFL